VGCGGWLPGIPTGGGGQVEGKGVKKLGLRGWWSWDKGPKPVIRPFGVLTPTGGGRGMGQETKGIFTLMKKSGPGMDGADARM